MYNSGKIRKKVDKIKKKKVAVKNIIVFAAIFYLLFQDKILLYKGKIGGDIMPAIYAHDRFGAKVSELVNGQLKDTIHAHYTQFQIGLQGPDIFFFYRPWSKNKVNQYGTHLHGISAYPFFKHALLVVRKKGRGSKEYAYLMGFICHFILDSECHPYVEKMIGETGVQHL